MPGSSEEEKTRRDFAPHHSSEPLTSSAGQMDSLFKRRLNIVQILFLFQKMYIHLPYVTGGR